LRRRSDLGYDASDRTETERSGGNHVMGANDDHREAMQDRDALARAKERRHSPRVLVDLEVDYGDEDTYLFAYIRDISATGIFVQTKNPEPPGTELNVRFTPNGMDEILELEGEVIWVNPYRPGQRDSINPGMGIRFTSLTTEQRHRLVDFVKRFAYLADDC
jgi:type IV pilus assembly protein PilZ